MVRDERRRKREGQTERRTELVTVHTMCLRSLLLLLLPNAGPAETMAVVVATDDGAQEVNKPR